MTDLAYGCRAALDDARRSINHGGLVEVAGRRGLCWVGEHPDCTAEHPSHIVSDLVARGLLSRIGRKPGRTAHITEAGLMELDVAGWAA